MSNEQEQSQREAARRYWAALITWYAGFAALAMLSGLFAAQPWPICAVLFGVMEAVTFLAAMYEDDWGNDFKGDREIFLRGTGTNALVALVFTAGGIFLAAR